MTCPLERLKNPVGGPSLVSVFADDLRLLLDAVEALERIDCMDEHWCPASPLFGADDEDADKFTVCLRCAALAVLNRPDEAA